MRITSAYAPPTRTGSYKWWVVFMLWFVCFLNYADRQAISAIFPKLRQEFGFSPEQIGLIGSAFMWLYAFASPIAGFIGDRVRRKHLILGGCVFWSCITVLTGRCAKFWQFFLVRASEGFGEAFYFPASMSLVSDYHTPATRSKALSFHQSSVYIGTVMGSWIAALLAQYWGWRSGFYFFGSAGIMLALVLYVMLKEPARGQSETMREGEAPAEPAVVVTLQETEHAKLPLIEALRIILAQPVAPLLMLAFLGANFVATIFLVWAPTFLVDKFHFQLATAGLSGTAFIHLTSALSAPLGGVLADHFSRRRFGGRMLVQAFGLLAGASFVFLVGSTQSIVTLLVTMTFFGFCKGLYDSNIFASLYDVVEPRARSTAAGLMNSIGWGGGALGPLFIGYFAQHGRYGSQVENMSHAIAWTAIVYIISGVLVLLAARLVSTHLKPGGAPNT